VFVLWSAYGAVNSTQLLGLMAETTSVSCDPSAENNNMLVHIQGCPLSDFEEVVDPVWSIADSNTVFLTRTLHMLQWKEVKTAQRRLESEQNSPGKDSKRRLSRRRRRRTTYAYTCEPAYTTDDLKTCVSRMDYPPGREPEDVPAEETFQNPSFPDWAHAQADCNGEGECSRTSARYTTASCKVGEFDLPTTLMSKITSPTKKSVTSVPSKCTSSGGWTASPKCSSFTSDNELIIDGPADSSLYKNSNIGNMLMHWSTGAATTVSIVAKQTLAANGKWYVQIFLLCKFSPSPAANLKVL
jgi:hypothetical protein